MVLDSSTFLNLVASEELVSIVEDLGRRVLICSATAEERLTLDTSDPDSPFVLINVEDIVVLHELMQLVALATSEHDIFVNLAATLADAEAMAVTIATSRRYTLASDDVRVRDVYTARCDSPGDLWSTPGLLREWQARSQIPEERLRIIVGRISRHARFRPKRTDPAWTWWTKLSA